MLAPQLVRRPSWAMAVLHWICCSSRGETRSRSTVSANSRMSATRSTLLSVRLSSAESLTGFSSSAVPSFSSRTMLLWLLAMWIRAEWSPCQPVSRMSSSRGVSEQTISMGASWA